MKRKDFRDLPANATPYPDANLLKVAEIMGDGSAASMALHDLAERRARGEDAVCYRCDSWFIVGPRADLS